MRFSTCALLLLVPGLLRAQDAVQKLEVYPAQVHLDGPRAVQRIGVLGHVSERAASDLSGTAKYVSSKPEIAQVDAQGVIRPTGDGEAVITVSAGGKSEKVAVKVSRSGADDLVSFTREIIPVLTKAGCNQGACHGAQHGKGGFRLSLLGFDAAFDHAQIVLSAEGRRIVVTDPERSILLTKPALLMEHGGGQRIAVNSREFNYLKAWLEDGVPEPSPKDPEVTALAVWPLKRTMAPGEKQQILVTATWKDGRVEDVTAASQFDTLNDSVATVTPEGVITSKNQGETHIMIRYCGQASVVQVTQPYDRIEPYPQVATNNFIDEKLVSKWKSLGLTPSPLGSDADFLRRIHLDLIGTMPTPAEVTAFLADKDVNKRAKAIDRVLNRPEFVDFWAVKWGDLLRISRDSMNERGMWSFHNWVRGSLRDGRPVDEMVRDIITAEGSTFTEGPANYFMTARNPGDWAENTSQLFLGVRIGCAKCHHHPFEKWSQDDYYGMAAFFVRLGTKSSQEFGLFGKEQVVYLKDKGEQSHPRKGSVVPPHPLDGPEMTDPIDRRVKLAEWLTAPSNVFFARNMVNRFWGYVMGRGLVEPLDDMRATNPASNPELLDALADDFIKSKFDLKHLLRTIVSSRAYQLSAQKMPGNAKDAQNVHYARFTVRRLAAEQLADALDYVAGTQEKYPGLPLGTKAIQLPDSRVKSYLLDVFGRPPRQITCECERVTQPNIAQALHLLNGDELNKRLAAPNGRIEKWFGAKKELKTIIEEMYLVTLARPARQEEVDRGLYWISQAPSPKEGVQDLMWALVNSREFLFNR